MPPRPARPPTRQRRPSTCPDLGARHEHDHRRHPADHRLRRQLLEAPAQRQGPGHRQVAAGQELARAVGREGNATAIAGYAVSGATAAAKAQPDGTKRTFASRSTKWIGAGEPRAAGGHLVYFGYNDINSFASLADSKTAYKNSVAKLVTKGVNQGERRMFLFLVHDWGKNPAQKGDPQGVYRLRTQEWNARWRRWPGSTPARTWSRSTSTTFENAFANPAAYGLTNVKTVDTFKSNSTALFADDNHFGEKGQDIIQQVFLGYATRGATWASQARGELATTAQARQRHRPGHRAGHRRAAAEQQLGFNAFAVGDLAQASLAPDAAAEADVAGRASSRRSIPTSAATASASTTPSPPTARSAS